MLDAIGKRALWQRKKETTPTTNLTPTWVGDAFRKMSTRLVLKCDGCDATAESEPIRKKFVSVSGRSYGLGSWQIPDLDNIVPRGWMWSDPVTACTYCPKCADEIFNEAA